MADLLQAEADRPLEPSQGTVKHYEGPLSALSMTVRAKLAASPPSTHGRDNMFDLGPFPQSSD